MRIINYAFFILFVLFTGCSKDETLETKSKISSYEKDIIQFSKIIAKGMNQDDFRLFLKNEAMKQFDGDYDILIASNLNKEIGTSSLKSKNTTLYEYLNYLHYSSNLKSGNVLTDSSFFDSLIVKYPLLQISIPEIADSSTENWDPLNQNLLVTFLPSDYNESSTDFLIAYDINGNEQEISAREEPSNPVIVISLNERLEVESNDIKSSANEMYFKNNYYTYYFPDISQSTDISESIPSLKNIYSSYDRDLKSGRDVLWKGTFVSKEAFRQVEGWPAGKPEFTVIIAYIDKSSGSSTASSITKIISEGGWVKRYVFVTKLKTKTINVPIMRWYSDRYGSDMKYNWMEKDAGGDGVKEITTVVTTKYVDNTTITSSVKNTFDNNDEEAGEAIVQYEDDTDGDGTAYNTGIVKFWVKQE